MAGGSSDRLAADMPKQYLPIRGSTPLRICVEKLLNHKSIDAVLVAINKSHLDLYESSVKGLDILPYIYGGRRRQDSVRNALEEIEKYEPKNVLIHDAARIFFKDQDVSTLFKGLKESKGAILATPINDTMKSCEGEIIKKTVPRDNMFLAQTPQAFDYKTILSLHKKHKERDVTDDASLCEIDNIDVQVVRSCMLNFKITNMQDFKLAEKLIEYGYETQG